MRAVLFSISSVLLLSVSPVSAVDLTDCPDTIWIEDGATAVLQSDLDCTGHGKICYGAATGLLFDQSCLVDDDCGEGIGCSPKPSIMLGHRASLDLNGHTLTTDGLAAVYCDGKRCEVHGPGTIVAGPWTSGILALKRLDVRDLTIQGGRDGLGIHGYPPGKVFKVRINAHDVVVDGPTRYGIEGVSLRLTDVVVKNCGETGIQARKVVRGKGIEASDNAWIGVRSYSRIVATDVVATGNSWGISSPTVRLSNATLANDSDDVITVKPPRLKSVTCNTSVRCVDMPAGVCHDDLPGSWGVCTGD